MTGDHATHWSTDGQGRPVNYSNEGLKTGAPSPNGRCEECVAELRRVGAANRAAASPADRAWADQEAAALRNDLARSADRLSKSLEERGIGAYTAPEIVCIRESLGLSQAALAKMLGVSLTAVKRWELAERAISAANAAALDTLVEQADRTVQASLTELQALPAHERVFVVYRDDAHLRAHHPDSPVTASWVRAVAGRVWRELACTIVYAD